MKIDHPTTILLLLVAIALWGNLLLPMLAPTVAQAQTRRVKYDIAYFPHCNADNSDQRLTQLTETLNKDAAQGWHVKGITATEDTLGQNVLV